MVRLKNWSVTTHPNDIYSAPEIQQRHLKGEVYDYPGRPDGEKVTTSAIVNVNGRVIKTVSREYLLDGPPDPGYVEYLNEIGRVLDEENPIKMI